MNEPALENPPFSPSPAAPSQGRGNGLAVASMVLGILSFMSCGPIFSVPAVVLGHAALARIRRGEMPRDSRGFAMAGVILGWCNIAFILLGMLIFLVFVLLAAGGAGQVSPFVYQL